MEQLRQYRRAVTPIQHQLLTGTGGEPDAVTETGTVQIVWGPMMDDLDVAGWTVGDVISDLRGVYRLPQGVVANVNGVEAGANTRLDVGDELEFVRAAGEKGGG